MDHLTDDLEALVTRSQELKKLLKETPEIITLLQLLKEQGSDKAVTVIKTDALLLAGQAATVLAVDKARIYGYVKEGLLKPYYTPGSSRMKFWLSEVKALAKEVAA